MLTHIILAIIQALTEFLPISSSGHLALVSSLITTPDIFFFTILHLASLLAVLIFTWDEIKLLFTFNKKAKKLWTFLIIATIPAALAGYYFADIFKAAFFSKLFIGIAFLINGFVLLITKNSKTFSKLNLKNSFAIGLAQVFAIFPGLSRSGITISTSRFLGISKSQAFKFSFLLFIPLVLGATILNFGQAYFSLSLAIAFIICLALSLVTLQLLFQILNKGKFWYFAFYSFAIGIVSLVLYFLY